MGRSNIRKNRVKVVLARWSSRQAEELEQKKLEIQRKLSELDELRRTVDAIPAEVIRAYTAQKYVHHGRMNQEI